MSLRSVERKKWARRQRRASRVRRNLRGTPERPRLSVYRSHRHFHCQLIDDTAGRTILSASSLQKGVRGDRPHGGNVETAKLIGQKIAEAAKEKGISKVVLDRNFFRFHGRVRAFAEAAAAGGLEFLTNPEKKDKKKEKKGKKGKGPAPEAKKEKKKKDKKGKEQGQKEKG